MRSRNIKLNVFLNEEEQNQLKEICKKYKISQSKLIRDIIANYTEKNISNKDIETIANTISNTINELKKLKSSMERLCYNKIVEQLDNMINELNIINKMLSK